MAVGPSGPKWAALVYMPSTQHGQLVAELGAGIGSGGGGQVGQASAELGPVVAGGHAGGMVGVGEFDAGVVEGAAAKARTGQVAGDGGEDGTHGGGRSPG